MSPDQWIELIAVVSVITLPALAITVRLALRPIVDAIIRLSEGVNSPPRMVASPPPADPMQRVLEEMEEMQKRVAELEAENAFHRELAKSGTATPGRVIAPKPEA